MHGQTVSEIKLKLQKADARQFAILEKTLFDDERLGVKRALEQARCRLIAEEAESGRLQDMYAFESEIVLRKGAHLALGIDEVGRGALAGPLAVCGVVLSDGDPIWGLNDSKKISPGKRKSLALQIKEVSSAYALHYIEALEIDRIGIAAALLKAVRAVIREIEDKGIEPDLVLLDGKPLHADSRELSLIKGDGRCPSIAAASIVAKVARDELMESFDADFPAYGFASNKGYGSADHMAAIRRCGLSPLHRASYCSFYTQGTLF